MTFEVSESPESFITLSDASSRSVLSPRTLTDVYGPGVAVCARPALEASTPVDLHRHMRDVLSARPIAAAFETPIICSAGGTDPLLLAVMRDGGLPVGKDLRTFRTEAEFTRRVGEVLGEGLRISMEYPQSAELCPDDRTIKSAPLVGYLNNKASIGTFVDPRFQARRTVVAVSELSDAAPMEKSWVLKAATDAAHGASLDVYLHQAGEPIVLPAFTEILHECVIEEYLYIQNNWGVQLYIGPDAKARLVAVTEQRIDEVGVYTGGRFGLVCALPPELNAECQAIAQRAADVGYRGLCSLDCAETRDGQLVVLDLNFRITSGSVPLLALQSVRADALDQLSESTKVTVGAPLEDLLTELRPVLAAGGLLVFAGHDTHRTDSPVKRTALHLLVFGDDADDVVARRRVLEAKFVSR